MRGPNRKKNPISSRGSCSRTKGDSISPRDTVIQDIVRLLPVIIIIGGSVERLMH